MILNNIIHQSINNNNSNKDKMMSKKKVSDLTKRELKGILSMLGASNTGNRTELLNIIKEGIPSAVMIEAAFESMAKKPVSDDSASSRSIAATSSTIAEGTSAEIKPKKKFTRMGFVDDQTKPSNHDNDDDDGGNGAADSKAVDKNKDEVIFYDPDGNIIDTSQFKEIYGKINEIEEAEPEQLKPEVLYPGAEIFEPAIVNWSNGVQTELRILQRSDRIGPDKVEATVKDFSSSSSKRTCNGNSTIALQSNEKYFEEAFNLIPNEAKIVFVIGNQKTSFLKWLLRKKYSTESHHDGYSGIIGDVFLPVKWEADKSTISHFGDNAEEAQEWLLSCGLASVPDWTKPYKVLSTGQKHRADLARRARGCYNCNTTSDSYKLPLVIDDFASHLDHQTAASCANGVIAMLKKIWKSGRSDSIKRVFFASNRTDVIKWIQPDIVLQLAQESGKIYKNPNSLNSHVPVIIDLGNLWKQIKSVESNENINFVEQNEFRGHLINNGFVIKNETHQDGNRKGFVLKSQTDIDAMTRSCDKLYDTSFTGVNLFFVPAAFDDKFDMDFRVGLIVGPSGSAKSVILERYFGAPTLVEWIPDLPVIDQLQNLHPSLNVDQVLELFLLDSVSLADKQFSQLSNSEQSRLNLARLLSIRGARIDEFTSGLERSIAKFVADNFITFCAPQTVLVSCYHDFLLPQTCPLDWIYETGTRVLYKLESQATRISNREKVSAVDIPVTEESFILPRLNLQLRRCNPDRWRLYQEHHYKTKKLSENSTAFELYLQPGSIVSVETPVAFSAVIPQIGGGFRAHRTVVLPEWQGFGIGSRLSDAVAHLHFLAGYRYFGQTVHPRFGKYRDKSPLWKPTEWNHTTTEYKIETWKQRHSNTRVKLRNPKFLYSHEYVGPDPSGNSPNALEGRITYEI